MFISVTSQDIAAGRPKSICGCPVALALQRVTGCPKAWAGRPFKLALDGGSNGTHDTPPSVEDFMRRMDAGEPVQPFIFELVVLTFDQASMLAALRDMEPAIEVSDADLIGSFTPEERAEFDARA